MRSKMHCLFFRQVCICACASRGCCFVVMLLAAALDAEGGACVTDALRSAVTESQLGASAQYAAADAQGWAWEKLHAGRWSEVSLVWRDAFAAACLLRAACEGQDMGAARRFVDLGLLMGGHTLAGELQHVAELLSPDTNLEECEQLPEPSGSSGAPAGQTHSPLSWPLASLPRVPDMEAPPLHEFETRCMAQRVPTRVRSLSFCLCVSMLPL